MSRPRVLVTGAAGFIARTLVPRLVEHADVTLLLREKFGSSRTLPPQLSQVRARVETVVADLRDYQLTAHALRQARPERVIHLAAVGVSDPFLDVNVALAHNVIGTLNLVRACFEGNGPEVQQLIVARTPGECTAMNIYAASKAAAWSFCQMYSNTAGWPIHGAMIYQAYGSDQPSHMLIPAALRMAKSGEDFPMTSGAQKKDWVHVDDVCAGIVSLLGTDLPPGTTVELGTGIATSVREIVEQLYAIVGRGGRPIPGALLDRPGEETEQYADAEFTATQIGWRAAISLTEGLTGLANNPSQ